MQVGRNTWIVVGVFAVVLIAAVLFVGRPGSLPAHPPQGGGNGTPTPAPTAPGFPSAAPKGEIVNGFPKDLVIGADATVAQSYAINYSSSTNQYTVEWTTARDMKMLFSDYSTYFTSNGWTIVNQITKFANSRGIYAVKNGASASVAIAALTSGGSKATVSYVAK